MILNKHEDLITKIIKSLERDPVQPVKDLAKKIGVNRTFLAGYLKALENQSYVKSKRKDLLKLILAQKIKSDKSG